VAAFPVGENRHRDGILETTVVPARVPERLSEEARALAIAVSERLAYVGVLGVELFVANGGRLFVNEVAPRPHNSGHYTMDACTVDQFEQQLRALCGLPLGEPRLLSPVAMINLLGDLWAQGEPRWAEALRRPGVRLHLYGKAEPRPGRKMGHLNCLARDAGQAMSLALEARAALVAAPAPAIV
jgi:5-(carboxyamino)imidazole ribonucleotide synthase